MITNAIYSVDKYVHEIKPNSSTSRLILMVPVISQLFFISKSIDYKNQYYAAAANDKMDILHDWKKLNDTAGWSRVQYIAIFAFAIIFIPPGLNELVMMSAFIINESILSKYKGDFKIRRQLQTPLEQVDLT